MVFIRTIFAAVLVACLVSAAGAAPPPPRPDTGIGLLLVRFPVDASDVPQLTLYREPGVGRIGEKGVAALPHLAQLLKAASGEYPLAVTARKGEWLRIHLDDAGREGWVEQRRTWPFLLWEEYLNGKQASLLRGIKKPFYVPRSGPGEQAAELEPLTPGRSFRIVAVEGDRVRILIDLAVIAWLRWRDDDGRLLITLE
ncbi:MAG: hypothetical protein ED859_03935 [Desulfuromonadales bacterium]|nr:MAG: hypothetical protein ED859_03935 [Desulfuromonadales bacterium]